jgi:hypothetical protein
VASQHGHASVVDVLLAFRADTEQRTDDGLTALSACCQAGNVPLAQKLLGQGGAQLSACSRQGRSCAWLACHEGHAEILKLLVSEAGADVEMPDNEGVTPFQIASEHGNLHVLEWLCRGGRRPAGHEPPSVALRRRRLLEFPDLSALNQLPSTPAASGGGGGTGMVAVPRLGERQRHLSRQGAARRRAAAGGLAVEVREGAGTPPPALRRWRRQLGGDDRTAADSLEAAEEEAAAAQPQPQPQPRRRSRLELRRGGLVHEEMLSQAVLAEQWTPSPQLSGTRRRPLSGPGSGGGGGGGGGGEHARSTPVTQGGVGDAAEPPEGSATPVDTSTYARGFTGEIAGNSEEGGRARAPTARAVRREAVSAGQQQHRVARTGVSPCEGSGRQPAGRQRRRRRRRQEGALGGGALLTASSDAMRASALFERRQLLN